MIGRSPFLNGPSFRSAWAEREGFVCCIQIEAPGRNPTGGTGVLVGPDLVLTNYHVIAALLGPEPAARPEHVGIRFDFKLTSTGLHPETQARLADQWLVAGSRFSEHDFRDGEPPAEDELDYALLRLAERIGDRRKWLELPDPSVAPSPMKDGFLIVLQHPGLGPQQLAFASNGTIGLNENGTRLRHRVNTRPGSSGSPCFDHEWNLIALHHGGDPSYPDFHRDAYNQAIPMARIVSHLRALGHVPPGHAEASTRVRPRLGSDKFEPTLLILCTERDRDRADQLLVDAAIPPAFIARIGNSPPATIADNAIAVFLGSDAALQDAVLLQTVDELRRLNLQVIPVVEALERFYQQTPKSLQAYNGVAWPPSAANVPTPLRDRVRQLLGLTVDPSLRSVLISYARKDQKDAVLALGGALRARREPYRVFIDLDEIPPGDHVQERIEQQMLGQSAVLYVETENAYSSNWILKELKWAYTRGLPLVVWQYGPAVRRRHGLIGSLPVHHTPDGVALADDHEAIARALDREIAEATAQRVQLRRMIEAVAKLHVDSTRDEQVVVEPVDGKPNLMRMILEGVLFEQVIRSSLLIAVTHHRPSVPLLRDLIENLDRSAAPGQPAYHRNGAVLVYDAPLHPLDEDEIHDLKVYRGNRLVYWIERQKFPAMAPELMARIR